MSAFSPAQSLSEYRVEKSRTDASITLSSGLTVHGCFFVAGSSRSGSGPERVKDLLNSESGFFPFETSAFGGATRTNLYNRDHVILVELADKREAHSDSGYDVAHPRAVTMLLSNGARLHGLVRVHRPHGRDRLSDFARASEPFCYLETERTTYLVNVRHLIELAEETSPHDIGRR